MEKIIRIGTRSSELALWQANEVAKGLNALEVKTEIVKIDSQGDLNLDKPLYELGIVGVFTKNLDIALLNGTIDIAVHSMKDVPTVLPKNVTQAAVLKRGGYNDVLVYKGNEEFLSQEEAIIATGSLRRKAQWLNRYPTHTLVDLRGNVNTRLNKLEKNENWNGAIFADAGLHRINIMPEEHVKLGWMVPAPAQGIVMITAKEDDLELLKICKELNHEETEICAHIERDFLNTLEGGCTAPIGAVAYIKDEKIVFRGALFSLDGAERIDVNNTYYVSDYMDIGKGSAKDVLIRGGKKLMLDLAEEKKKINILSTKELAITQTDLFGKEIGFKMSDFISIRYNRLKPKVVKNPIENVIITSQNGVDALLQNFSSEELSFKNIYCVGRRTKRLIERKISKVTHVENSVKELADYLTKQKEVKEVTYFCGNKKRDELEEILLKNEFIIHNVEVYRTLLNTRNFENDFDGIMFYSPSGIESYLIDNPNKKPTAFCIGQTTANEAKKHFDKVEVAQLATIESVIKLVNDHYSAS